MKYEDWELEPNYSYEVNKPELEAHVMPRNWIQIKCNTSYGNPYTFLMEWRTWSRHPLLSMMRRDRAHTVNRSMTPSLDGGIMCLYARVCWGYVYSRSRSKITSIWPLSRKINVMGGWGLLTEDRRVITKELLGKKYGSAFDSPMIVWGGSFRKMICRFTYWWFYGKFQLVGMAQVSGGRGQLQLGLLGWLIV